MSDGYWVRVSLPWATFGLRCRAGIVVSAAPIARWAVGRRERVVADYYREQGATFERLPQQLVGTPDTAYAHVLFDRRVVDVPLPDEP